MLNYADTTNASTDVPLLSAHRSQSPVTEPLPTSQEQHQQGREAGRADARALLLQAEQQKGAALTKNEIREIYVRHFDAQMRQWDLGLLEKGWFDGWCRGFVEVCTQAGHAAPDEPVSVEAEPPVVRTLVTFRQATIEVDDPDAFFEGIMCGQVSAVEERKPLTGEHLFWLFEDAVRDEEASETWLTGYLLGLADAICRKRQRYPRRWRR